MNKKTVAFFQQIPFYANFHLRSLISACDEKMLFSPVLYYSDFAFL